MKINRCNRFLSFLRRFFAASSIVVSFFGAARAAQISWSGATDTAWATGTNWTGGVAPASSITTDTALFNLATYTNLPNAGTRLITGITIGDGTTATGALTLSGTQLTIGASGIDMKASAGAVNITSPVTQGAAQTWQNASANTLTVGPGAITKAAFLLTVGGAGNTDITGALTGASALTKTGAGTLTLSATGNTYTGLTTVNAGTLIVSGGTITATPQVIVGATGGTGTPVFNLTGGTVTATAAANVNALHLGGTASFPGSATVSGGQFNSSVAGALVTVGDNAVGSYSQTGGTVNTGSTGALWVANNAGGSGSTVSVSGGTLNCGSGTSVLGTRGSYVFTVSGTGAVNMGSLQFGHTGGTTNNPTGRILNLEGGTLRVTNSINYAAGTAVVNLNGGTLQANSTNANFWNNNSNVTATIGASGVTIDTQAFDNTISQVLGGSGGLTKIGAGSLILNGANYTGATTVSAGSLSIPETSPTTTLSVADGTTLAITGAAGIQIGTGASGSSLTLGSTPGAGGATLSIKNFVSGGSPLVFMDTFTTKAAVQGITVNVSGIFTGTGTYPLIWSNAAVAGNGFGALKLGTLPRNIVAALENNNGGQDIDLNVTAFNPTIWAGNVNSTWDVETTSNWTVNAVSDVYKDTDVVLFNDSASGTGAVSVNLGTTATPSSVAVNNPTRAYTIGGSGAIAGTGGIAKSGAASLTLGSPNTFTGPVSLSGGTLIIGHANALGATGALAGTNVAAGTVLDLNGFVMAAESVTLNGTGISSGGALINSSVSPASTAAPITLGVAPSIGGAGNMTLSGDITGTTGLTKVGAGVTTFNNRKSYTGNTVINGGILDLTGGGGTGGTIRDIVTVNPGGSLRISTGDATGYALGTDRLTAINLLGGNLNVNTTGNQTLGAAALTMQGATLTGVAGSNLDFFTQNNADPLIRSSFTTLASATSSVVSGVRVKMRQDDGVVFTIADGAAAIDLDIQSQLAADAATNMRLFKTGPGTMRISGLSTYAYPTVIDQGTLIVPAVQSSPSFDAQDNTGLVITGNPGSSFSVTSLTMGDGGATSLGILNFGEQTSPANAPVKASGTLDFYGSLALSVNGSFTTAGSYPLISYPIGGYVTGSLDAITLALPPNVSGTLQDNPISQTVDLVLSAVNTLIWNGSPSGLWDVNTTANWFTSTSAPDGKYQENMVVRLDDSATGTTSVVLNSVITPSGVTVNNPTKNYTISGTGGIAGNAGLTKTGAGTLTLATTNTYSGLTTISAGILQLGNGGTVGSVAGSILNNAALVLNNDSANSLPGVVSGTGSLTKLGSGVATLTAAPTYTGATTIIGGTLQVPSLTATSSITNNATLAFNQITTTQVNPAGVITGSGAVAYTGPAVATSLFGQYLVDEANTYAGETTISTSRVALSNVAGISSGPVTINDGGQLYVSAGAVTVNNALTLNGLGWPESAGQLGALRLQSGPTIAGPITLASNSRISAYGSFGFITGVISGNYDLEFSANGGAEPIHLIGTSVNTYTGKTILNNAMVYLNKTGTPAIFGNVQMGAGNTAQPRLVMQKSNQFGPGVEMIHGNVGGNWARFEMQGTNQTLAGISTGTTTTQGGAMIQNRALGDTSSNWGTATLTLNGSGDYVYNGHLRDSDNGQTITNQLALVKNGTGTQTLVGTVVDLTGPTTLNQGVLRLFDVDDWHASAIQVAGGTTLKVDSVVRTFNGFRGYGGPVVISGTGEIRKAGAMNMGWSWSNGAIVNLGSGALINVQEGSIRLEYGGSGNWTNNKADLNIAAGASFNAWDSGNVLVDTLTGNGSVIRGYDNTNSAGTGTLTLGVDNGTGTFDGIIEDRRNNVASILNLAKRGTGTQTLNGANTYAGTTSILQGTLALGASGSIVNSSAVTIASGAVFDVSATAGFTQGAGKSLTGGRTSGSGNDIVGNFSTAGTVNVAGTGTPGTLTVSGDLAFNGGGTLQLDVSSTPASGNDLISAVGDIDLIGTTTVTPLFNGAPNTANPYTILSGNSVTGDASTALVSGLTNSRYTLTFDSTTSLGDVLMNVVGTGKSLVWSGAAAEVWTAEDDLKVNWNAGADFFKNLDAVTFNDTNANGTVTLSTTVSPSSISVGTADAGVTAYTISGIGSIAGGGKLTKTGTATLTLSTANTFGGGTVISQGEIRSTNGSSMGVNTVTLNDANTGANNTAFLAAAAQTINNNVVVANNGTGAVTLGSVSGQAGLVSYNGNFTLGKAVTINGSSDSTTFAGKISGSGNIAISGAATHRVTFANPANDFTGGLTINAGLLYQSDSPTALPPTTDIANAGTYRLNGGATHSVDSIDGAGEVLIIAGGPTTLSIGNDNGASNISGVISTALSLVKNGAGSLTLGGANTYTGTTTLNAGPTLLTNSSALGSSVLVWDNLPGTLDLGTLTAVNIGGLQGAQNFSMLNASSTPVALTLGTGNVSSTTTGALLGGTTLTKTGTGSFTMAGTSLNTYTGLTYLNQGVIGLSKVGTYAIPGNFTGNNANSPDVFTTYDNQFAPGCVMRFEGTTGDHVRLELLGTTQTLAGIDNTTGSARGVIQTREQVLQPNVSPLSTLILDVPTAATYSFNGYLRNSGGTMKVIKNGLGTQTLSGTNINYSGSTIINAGVLNCGAGNTTDNMRGGITINAGATLQSVAATNIYDALNMNGGTLAGVGLGVAQYGHFVLGTNLTVGGTQQSLISADVRVGSSADRTINVGVTGDPSGIDLEITGKFGHLNGSSWGYITKAGAGTMRFNGSTYNNTTTNIASDIGRITVNAGKVIFKDYMAGMGDGGLILNAGGTADADMGIGVDYTYASKLAGTTGVFNKIGVGNLTISGTGGTFAGNINVIDGKLIGKAAGAFGAASNTRTITVSAGKTLEFHAANVFGNHSTTAAPIVVEAGGVITNADPAATGKINNGLGSLTLNDGVLHAAVGNGISTIDDTNRPGEGYGAWGLNGTVTSTGASTISSAVAGMGGRVLLSSTGSDTTFAVTSGVLTVSAPLQGGEATPLGGLAKTGAGKLILSAANIYSGPTTVNSGTLELTGSLLAASGVTLPSNITVGTGATLMGTGAATGTLAANGIIAPGSSIGTLAVGATSFGATGSLTAEINSTTLQSDKLAVTGALTIDPAATLNVTDLGSGTLASAKLVLISYTGALTGTFAGLPDDSTLVVNGNTYTIDYNATDSGTNAVVLRIGSADPFEGWAAGYGLTGGDALKGADPDGDGVINLLEFATNADPTSGSSGPRAYPLMHVIGDDNALTYTLAVRKNAVFTADGTKQTATQDMVVYTVEASNDLATWTVVPVTEVTGTTAADIRTALGAKLTTPPIGADWEWRTFRTDLGAALDPSDQVRLRVTEAP